MVAHCFNFQFPDDTQYGISFYNVFFCHLHNLFCDMSVKIFKKFYNWIVSLLLIFKNSVYILDDSSLSGMSFMTISQYVSMLFLFLDLAFYKEKKSILMKSDFSIPSWIMLLELHLKCHCQTQDHLNLILYYVIGVLYFCVLYLGLWSSLV